MAFPARNICSVYPAAVLMTSSFPAFFQVRGFNDGGWFTLFPNFGEELAQGTPYFFSTLEVVSIEQLRFD